MNKYSIALTLLAAGCASLPLCAERPSEDTLRLFANAPLRFEPAGSGYLSRGPRFSSSLHGDHMDLRSKDQAMRLTFVHASPGAHLDAGELLNSKTNILHGRDRTKWRTLPNYANLHAHDLYHGIDLVYYGNHGELEYDLIVKPGASPDAIRLRIDGVTPSIDGDGNLTAAFIQKKPVAYQLLADGTRQPVTSRYRRNSDGTFSFVLGRYDKRRELVIDPTLTFSLYISDLAGSSQQTARAIAHDAAGNIYIGGFTLSTDFEQDPNVNDQMPGGPQFPNNDGGYDMFLVQINPGITQGNPVQFATYLGGSNDDLLTDIFVAPSGLLYLTGNTTSVDFPTGNIAGYQQALTGNADAVVCIYDMTQPVGLQLVYASYMGGGTGASGNGVVADSNGRVFIVGTTNSSEVPVMNGLPTGLNGPSDAFVAGFDPSPALGGGLNSLIYSTFIGGSMAEQGYGITIAPDGTLWVVGQTYSPDFPLYGNSYQTTLGGTANAFVAQIDLNQPGVLAYSSYLGASIIDTGWKVKVNSLGNVVIAGYTTSGDFPVTSGAMQPAYSGQGDVFVSVLNPTATGSNSQLLYSTFYGGGGAELPYGLVIDSNNTIYVSGLTASNGLFGATLLPVSANALENIPMGGQDGFVLVLNPQTAGVNGLMYSSYVTSLGQQVAYGIDVVAGTIYLTGYSTGGVFDAIGGVAKTSQPNNIDGFVMGFTLP